jgi:hypothetical protein
MRALLLCFLVAGCGGGGGDERPEEPFNVFDSRAYENDTDDWYVVELTGQANVRRISPDADGDRTFVEFVWRRIAKDGGVAGGGSEVFRVTPFESFVPIRLQAIAVAHPRETVVLKIVGRPNGAFEVKDSALGMVATTW